MVETTEDDLARELEELKNSENRTAAEGEGGGDDGDMPTGPAKPRRRAPPRRKTGSSNLTAFNGAAAGEGDGDE